MKKIIPRYMKRNLNIISKINQENRGNEDVK